MWWLLMLGIIPAFGCLNTYKVRSGARTKYYDSSSGQYIPALVLPLNAYHSEWVTDSEAKWVWWTTHWTAGTKKFRDTIFLADWAVDRINTALMYVAADDHLTVILNGVTIFTIDQTAYATEFLVLNLKGNS